ncbi:Protein quaking-B [Larimichthys crocea]|uniref:Uncharacterized protein n=1 Tax=Larimichthys crocea TaxID=215358 RepID=A0ACD3RT88_LARCR|nr:Protein quaking-B [Larimichthys crocea]
MVGETEVKERPKSNPDYLMQLMNDRKVMSSLPNFSGIFTHLERLLDEEIGRVRKDMYNDTVNGGMFNGRDMEELPEAIGPVAQLQEKLYVPVKEYPDEEMNRGKPNWEHLSEDLHVLITVEDTHNRAKIKLQRAINEVKKLLVPAAEGEDNLKKMQLMELAILNGTYRDANVKTPTAAFPLGTPQAPRIITGPTPVLPPSLRNPAPVTTPTIMPLIRQIQSSALVPGGNPHPALVQQGPESGIIYTPYEYPYTLTPSILEYPIDSTGVLAGAMTTKVRRHDKRIHPYQRVVTPDRVTGMSPLSPYLNVDPRYLIQDTDEFILPTGANKTRGRFELAFFTIGGSCMTGAALGAVNGLRMGLKETRDMAWSKPRNVQIINMVTRQGASWANSLGSVALLYSVFGVAIEKARGAEDDINTVAAGTLTGMLFKSGSGIKGVARGGLAGLALSGAYALYNNWDHITGSSSSSSSRLY